MQISKTMGTGISPFAAWLCLRGTKTLELRVRKSTENAGNIAKFLESHPKIEKVFYPGLKSHPQHAICKKQSKGFGAMVSFYVKGDIKATARLLKALKVFTLAESLGGVESLISMPAIMTHSNVAPEIRKTLGIHDNFVRCSVGIETCDDLINDLKNALSVL